MLTIKEWSGEHSQINIKLQVPSSHDASLVYLVIPTENGKTSKWLFLLQIKNTFFLFHYQGTQSHFTLCLF